MNGLNLHIYVYKDTGINVQHSFSILEWLLWLKFCHFIGVEGKEIPYVNQQKQIVFANAINFF